MVCLLRCLFVWCFLLMISATFGWIMLPPRWLTLWIVVCLTVELPFCFLGLGGGQSKTSGLFLNPGMELPFGCAFLYLCQGARALFIASLRETWCFSAYSVTNWFQVFGIRFFVLMVNKTQCLQVDGLHTWKRHTRRWEGLTRPPWRQLRRPGRREALLQHLSRQKKNDVEKKKQRTSENIQES